MKNAPFLKTIIVILVLISTKQIFAQTPTIYSFTPTSGSIGTVVKIYGYYFNLANSGSIALKKTNRPPVDYTEVKFGSFTSIPTMVTDTYIEVPVPQLQIGQYKIWVYNANGGTESAAYFNLTPPPPPPISNIAYLHGFGAATNNSVWQYAQGLFNQEFITTHSTNTSYNGLTSISQTASSMSSSLVPYANTVVVAHSMGGVLAREIKRQQGSNSNIRALITVGTPHTGAPIVANAKNNLGTVIGWWLSDLANGWYALGYSANDAYYTIALYYLAPLIDIYNELFDPADLNSAAAQDLGTQSNFITTLNANPSATLPPAIYTVYGQEDWYSHWRLADAFINGSETGDGLSSVLSLVSSYASLSYYFYDYADYYWEEFSWSGDLDDLEQCYYWAWIGDCFFSGAYKLNSWHQQDWNNFIVGETIPTQQVYDRNPINDAFIPTYSQAPSFVSSDKHYLALHTNHIEETITTESIAKIREALLKPDINLPVR